MRLVMSIPGSYEGWENMDKMGVCRIGAVIKEEGWTPSRGEKAVVEYQVCITPHLNLDQYRPNR